MLLDFSSWPYTFAIASITLAVVLISPGQLKLRSEVINVAGSLALGGLGVVAVLSANPITLLLAWAAIDISELLIMLRSDDSKESQETALQVFTSRIAGMMLVLWSFLTSRVNSGSDANFTNMNPDAGLLLLLGIGLRIGVFPLHLPYSMDKNLRRGQGTLLRMVPAASSLVVLSRFQIHTIDQNASFWLSLFAFFALILTTIRWAFDKDDLNARPFWMISLSALAILCVFNDQPFFSISWGMVLLYQGSILFILDSSNRLIRALGFVALLSIIGIPYSISASGFLGALNGANIIWWAFFLVSTFLLAVGFFLKVRSKPAIPPDQEQIIYLTYPASILLLTLSSIFTGIFGWHNSRIIGFWYIPITFLIAAIGLFIWNRRTRQLSRIVDTIQHFSATSASPQLAVTLDKVVNLRWLYPFLRKIFTGIGRVVDSLTFLLEGTGGILWAFLILAIILAVTRMGGN